MYCSLKKTCLVFIVFLCFLFFSAASFAVTKEDVLKTCDGKYKGVKLSPVLLKEIVANYGASYKEVSEGKYTRTTKEGLENLCGADLRGADLKGATLWSANLMGANMERANLSGAVLREADLIGAVLRGADLSRADLMSAFLVGADMTGANLSGSRMGNASLTYADLDRANLTKADLSFTNMEAVNFELKPGAIPDGTSIFLAENISKMTFRGSPHSLIELREAFKKDGFREQAAQITYAIERTRREHATSGKLSLSSLDGFLRFIAFEITSDYGMSPGRPIFILFGFIFIFFIPYFLTLFTSEDSRAGIWKEWSKDRILKNQDGTELIRVRGARKAGYAFYFSVLSAFHLGWRDLNVGTWISKMQFNEYALRPTGWVRTVSGLQSLISVYLLALSVLSYFGSPFE